MFGQVINNWTGLYSWLMLYAVSMTGTQYITEEVYSCGSMCDIDKIAQTLLKWLLHISYYISLTEANICCHKIINTFAIIIALVVEYFSQG